jgi:hypothetical protein
MPGSSCCQLARPNADDLPPSLQPHYRTFSATTRQSAPLRRIGTFGLAVLAACAFSLGIAGQVLTFHIGAWLSFAPSICRMPLGRYQDILRAYPGGRVTPRFRHRLIRFRHFTDGSLALALYGAFSVNHLFIVSFFVRSGVRFFAPIRSSA